MTMASPSGFIFSWSRSAIWATASSWICGRHMIHSAMRAYLDRPIRLEWRFGITPTQRLPMIGHRWCEHALRTRIGPTIISSLSCSTLGNSVTSGALA
ncbi:hypothetical protein D3C81_2071930 [compost metagenome]